MSSFDIDAAQSLQKMQSAVTKYTSIWRGVARQFGYCLGDRESLINSIREVSAWVKHGSISNDMRIILLQELKDAEALYKRIKV